MSAQKTARKAALTYWGFSSKITGNAPTGVDLSLYKEFKTNGLEDATAPLLRFAKSVDKVWEDYTGNLSSHGRLSISQLYEIAVSCQGEDAPKPSNETIDKWIEHLVDADSNVFLAVSFHLNISRKLLIKVNS